MFKKRVVTEKPSKKEALGESKHQISRRGAIGAALVLLQQPLLPAKLFGTILTSYLSPAPAFATEEVNTKDSKPFKNMKKDVEVYFGLGCFWHIQHEFVQAERDILGRSDEQLTAQAGYAGGTLVGKSKADPEKEVVCYHNVFP